MTVTRLTDKNSLLGEWREAFLQGPKRLSSFVSIRVHWWLNQTGSVTKQAHGH
jgi:hypothetical protein